MPFAVTLSSFNFKVSSSKEPELTPILIATCFSFALLITFLTFSSPPILPGLILILSIPLSIARSANL